MIPNFQNVTLVWESGRPCRYLGYNAQKWNENCVINNNNKKRVKILQETKHICWMTPKRVNSPTQITSFFD